MEQNRKKLLTRPVIIGLVAVLLLLTGIVYVSFLRLPDSEFDSAGKQVDTMIAKAAALQKNSELTPFSSSDQLTSAKQDAQSYADALGALQKSKVVSANTGIRNAYNNAKQDLVSYGISSVNTTSTLAIVGGIKQACGDLMQKTSTITSAEQLSAISKSCGEALDNSQTVPSTDFNEQYYQEFHKQVNAQFDALWSYYQSSTVASRSEASLALRNAFIAEATYDSKVVYPKLATAPVSFLQSLKSVIEQQRTNPFR